MHTRPVDIFYGWRVVGAAFTLAVFGLGMGFHGPAIYLHAIHEKRGWPLDLVSAAVTVHFLVGAIVVANLPALYRRFGIPKVTKAGAILLAVGVFCWAIATAPWQLFVATLLSGAGWVTMSVAAINAIVAPCTRAPNDFIRREAVAGIVALARSQIPDGSCGHGAGFVRADRLDRPTVLAAGSRAWRNAGRSGDGTGDDYGHH